MPALKALTRNRWVAIGAVGAVAAAAVGVAALSKGGGGGASGGGGSGGSELAGVQAGAAAAASGFAAGAQLGATGFQTGAQLGQGALELAGRVTDVLGRTTDTSVSSLARIADSQTRALQDVLRSGGSAGVGAGGTAIGGGATTAITAKPATYAEVVAAYKRITGRDISPSYAASVTAQGYSNVQATADNIFVGSLLPAQFGAR